MTVDEIMTVNPAVVTPTDDLTMVAGLMRDHDVGVVPVVADRRNMRLEGLITDRDIVMRRIAEGIFTQGTAEAVMTSSDLATAHPSDDIHEVLALMAERQVRRIPVLDDLDRLVGIVSQADIARYLGPDEPAEVEELLEEISEPPFERVR
jgi:CBS domain-containing protein